MRKLLPADLIAEAARGMCLDCQRSFKVNLERLVKLEDLLLERTQSHQSVAAPDALRSLLFKVATKHRIAPNILIDGGKETVLVAARTEFCIAARKHGYSLKEIGRVIKRDHTTVLHMANK